MTPVHRDVYIDPLGAEKESFWHKIKNECGKRQAG